MRDSLFCARGCVWRIECQQLELDHASEGPSVCGASKWRDWTGWTEVPPTKVELQVTGSMVLVTGETRVSETKCWQLECDQCSEAHVYVVPVPGASMGCASV